VIESNRGEALSRRVLSRGGRRFAVIALAILVTAVCLSMPSADAKGTEERAALDTPAGAEYALPLDRAREQAGAPEDGRPATGGASGEATSGAPLFGFGIGRGEAGVGRFVGSPRGTDAARPGAAASRAPDARTHRAIPATDEVGGSSIVGPIALGLAVLLLGASIGLLLRRWRSARARVDVILATALAAGCGVAPLWHGLYSLSAWGPIALGLLAALVALTVARRPKPSPLGLVTLAGLALLWTWATLSTRWAESADQALLEANRWLLYAALLAVLLLIARDGRAGRLLVAAGALATVAFAAYLCFRLLLPGSSDLFLGGRLSDPLGYVNGQAAHLLLALWPALAVAELARRPRIAGLALAVAVLLCGLVVLSQARAVAIAGLLSVALMLAIVPGRRRRAWCLLTLGAGVALAVGPLLEVYAATSPGARRPDEEALRIAILLLCVASALAGVAWGSLRWLADRPSSSPARGRLRAASGLVLALVGVAVVTSAAVAVGDPAERARAGVREFKALDVDATQDSRSRFASGGGNRYDYWRVAAGQFGERPLAGIGAGNYDVTYFAERRTTEDVRQPHSLPLQALAELGLVGLLAVGLLAAGPLIAIVRLARRAGSSRDDRVLAVAAGGTFVAWLVHTSVDWLHLIPGVTGIALCAAAALVTRRPERPGPNRVTAVAGSSGRRRHRHGRGDLGLAAACVTAAVLGAVLVASPLLADRHTAAAQDLIASNPAAALREAGAALRLNDESLPAYYAQAAAHARRADYGAARGSLLAAAEREPHDFVTWALLGDLALRRGAFAQARIAYGRAARLNPRDRELRHLVELPRLVGAGHARSTTAN
jgi:O-Antigen ligase